MKTVNEIMAEAFDPSSTRTPRSPEYQAGARAALAYRIEGGSIRNPYRIGTAQADAFFSGTDEGHRLWRAALAADQPPDPDYPRVHRDAAGNVIALGDAPSGVLGRGAKP